MVTVMETLFFRIEKKSEILSPVHERPNGVRHPEGISEKLIAPDMISCYEKRSICRCHLLVFSSVDLSDSDSDR